MALLEAGVAPIVPQSSPRWVVVWGLRGIVVRILLLVVATAAAVVVVSRNYGDWLESLAQPVDLPWTFPCVLPTHVAVVSPCRHYSCCCLPSLEWHSVREAIPGLHRTFLPCSPWWLSLVWLLEVQ